ncbi:MAG TPA: hypothetical protein VE173_16350, partial [Longimicrobiales bacterium]|nr:hypothetical protein [Longimicrobiales bacterium]
MDRPDDREAAAGLRADAPDLPVERRPGGCARPVGLVRTGAEVRPLDPPGRRTGGRALEPERAAPEERPAPPGLTLTGVRAAPDDPARGEAPDRPLRLGRDRVVGGREGADLAEPDVPREGVT